MPFMFYFMFHQKFSFLENKKSKKNREKEKRSKTPSKMIYFAIFARLLFLAYLIIVAWQVVVLYKEIVALIGQFFSQSES